MAARTSRVRQLEGRDAGNAAGWIAREFPLPPDLRRALPTLLGALIAEGVLEGIAVENVKGDACRAQLAAFGIAGFISGPTAAQYLADPVPHLELTLLDRWRRGQRASSFLDRDGIARGNARGGVTLVPLFWLQRPDDMAEAEARELLAIGQQGFLRAYRGYRLERILKEAAAERAGAFLAGGFREHHRLPAGTPLSFPGMTLAREHRVLCVTRSDLEHALPGSAVGSLFRYHPPHCAFTRAELQVLQRAEEDMTDAEIAADLGVTENAIGLRWRSIYTRVSERAPSTLRFDGRRHGPAARGMEKRRQVVAFIRRHPEELRPYAWPRKRGQ